ncbi:MAG: gliding motility-associated C-terminal domain-containing protein [Cytophagales bacterium]|nr:gliding motility-associated C-terminal domain-containing protein [Cytophagales bacterium]
MVKKLLLIFISISISTNSFAQTLAEERFNYNGGQLVGAAGGFGWHESWKSPAPVGAWIYNSTPFAYPGYTSTTNYAHNLGITPNGRNIDLESMGNNFEPFTTLTSDINQCGTTPVPCKMVGRGTIYVGFLFRKTINNDDDAFISLNVGDKDAPYEQLENSINNKSRISFGYFAYSFAGVGNIAGNKYWAIATHNHGSPNVFNINNTKPIIINGDNFLVLRIRYIGSSTTISGFINPPVAVSEPATPDINVITTGFAGFRSFSWSNFDNGGNSNIDEIRFGARFQDVHTTTQCPGAANVSFYYGSGTLCKNTGSVTPTFADLSVPGTFFSTASGILGLNAVTGQVNIGPTLTGSYFINYSIPGSGICRDVTVNYEMQVTATPNTILDKSNTLTGSAICKDIDATITLQNSQIGITYEVIKAGTPGTYTGIRLSAATAGDDLTFDIPATMVGVGLNVFSVAGTIRTFIDSTAGRPKRGNVALRSTTAITLDGVLTEPGWNFRNRLSKKLNTNSHPLFNSSDNDVRFGTMWDNTYLYVGMQFIDNTFPSAGVGDYDNLEIYLYGNASIPRTYWAGTGDSPVNRFNTATQFILNNSNTFGVPLTLPSIWPSNRAIAQPYDMQTEPRYATNTVSGAFGTTLTGRTLEFRIAWTTLGVNLPNDFTFLTCSGIAFDMAKNDHLLDGTTRIAQYMYNGDGNNYQFTRNWGTLQLTLNSDTTEIMQNVSVVTVTSPTVTGATISHVTNCALTNGAVTFNGSGSIYPLQYSITGAGFQSSNIFSGRSAGTYTGIVRNSDGTCPANIAAFVITIPSAPTITGVTRTNTTNCDLNNGSVTITGLAGTGSPEFSIDGSTWQASNVFTSLAAGAYTAYMRNATAGTCSITGATVTITGPYPTPSFSYGTTPFCNNTAIFTQTGTNYRSNGIFVTTAAGVPLTAVQGTISAGAAVGTHTVVYTIPSAGFCVGISTFNTVTITSSTIGGALFASALNICSSTGITLSVVGYAGTINWFERPVGTASWAPLGQTTPITTTLIPTTTTSYMVSITGVACSLVTTTSPLTITVNGYPNIGVATTASPTNCDISNASLTISGTFEYGTPQYRINTGAWQASPIFNALAAGTYTTYMRNSGGVCSVTGGTTTITGPYPTPSFSYGSLPFCNGITIFTQTGANYRVNGVFSTTAAGVTIAPANGTISIGAALGEHTVTYDIPSAGFCTAMSTFNTVTITSSTVGGALMASATNICSTTGITLSVVGYSGNINWYRRVIGTPTWLPMGETSDITTELFPTTTTSYMVSITGVSCGVVTTTSPITVTVNGFPIILASTKTDPSNCGVNDGNISLSGTGSMALEYRYSTGAWQSAVTFGSLAPGSYTPEIRYTTLPSCSTSGAALNLSTPNSPSISGVSLSHVTDCGLSDGIITVTGSAGSPPYEFRLNNGSWVSANIFNTLAAASYTLDIRNQSSPACSVIGATFYTITIPSFASVTGYTMTQATDCTLSDGVLTLDGVIGTGTSEYSLDGTSWQLSPIFSGRAAGAYSTFIRNSNGTCSTTGINTTVTGPNPTPTLGYGSSIWCTSTTINTQTGTNLSGGSFVTTASGLTLDPASGSISSSLSGSAVNIYQIVYTIPASGFCTGSSNFAEVSIIGVSIGGNMSGDNTITIGNNSGVMSVSGYDGTILTWQKSVNSGAWVDIANTSDTYSEVPSALGNNDYRVVVSNGICSSVTSTNFARIMVAGTQGFVNGGPNPVCVNTPVNPLSLVGANGFVSHWEYSSDGGSTWTIYANTTTLLSGFGTLSTQGLWQFRASVSGVGYSIAETITAVGIPSLSNQKTDETACDNDDGAITLTGSGSINSTYEYNLNTGSWSATNDFGNLAPNNHLPFVRVTGLPSCSLAGSAINVAAAPALQMGTLTQPLFEICSGANISMTLNNWRGQRLNLMVSVPGTAYTLANQYLNITTSTGFGLISSTVNITSLTSDMRFIFSVSGGNCTSVTSATGIVTFQQSNAGNIVSNLTSTTICSDFGAVNLSTTGVNRAPAYRWETSPDNITFAQTATTAGYTSSFTQTRHIRAYVKNGECAESASLNTYKITVLQKPVLLSFIGPDAYCSSSDASYSLAGSNLDNATVTSTNTNAPLLKISPTNWKFDNLSNYGITTLTAYVLADGVCAITPEIIKEVKFEKYIDSSSIDTLKYSSNIFCNISTVSPINWDDTLGYFSASHVDGTIMSINTFSGAINLTNINKLGRYTISYQYVGNNVCSQPAQSTMLTIVGVSPGFLKLSAPAFTPLCLNQNALIDLENYIGVPTWYQKTKNGSWTMFNNVDVNEYNTQGLTDSVSYKVVVSSSVCPSYTKETEPLLIPVIPDVQIGTIQSEKAEVCELIDYVLTLTGYSGTSVTWSYNKVDSTSKSKEWKNIESINDKGVNVLDGVYDAKYGSTIFFRAYITNYPGCAGKFTGPFVLKRCDQDIFIPNVITPNTAADANNSYWNLTNLRLPDQANIYIFNRYGVEVFRATGREYRIKPWNGDGLPAGTYYYMIEYNDQVTPTVTSYIVIIR